jgi:hypothetical protein
MKTKLAIASAAVLGAAILVSTFIVRTPRAVPSIDTRQGIARQTWCDAHDIGDNPINCFLEYDKRDMITVHVVPALRDSPTYGTSLDVHVGLGRVLLVNPPADPIVESTAKAPNNVDASWFQFKTFAKK